MELVWRGSDAYGSESELFVSQAPSGYYTTPLKSTQRYVLPAFPLQQLHSAAPM